MTRRFGLKGGLAWLGVLTFGVLSEQLKTRRETREAIENTKDVRAEDLRTVELPSGVTYVEYTRGGGGARAKAVSVRGETARARGFGGERRVRHRVGGTRDRVVVRGQARTAVVSRVRGRRRRDATGRATRRARARAIGVRERRRGFPARR